VLMQAYRWMADSRVSRLLLPCTSDSVLELTLIFLPPSGLLHRRPRRQTPEHLLPLPMPHHLQRQLSLSSLSALLLFLADRSPSSLCFSSALELALRVLTFVLSPFSRRVRLPFADLLSRSFLSSHSPERPSLRSRWSSDSRDPLKASFSGTLIRRADE